MGIQLRPHKYSTLQSRAEPPRPSPLGGRAGPWLLNIAPGEAVTAPYRVIPYGKCVYTHRTETPQKEKISLIRSAAPARHRHTGTCAEARPFTLPYDPTPTPASSRSRSRQTGRKLARNAHSSSESEDEKIFCVCSRVEVARRPFKVCLHNATVNNVDLLDRRVK
jgi:hypothetical protein